MSATTVDLSPAPERPGEVERPGRAWRRPRRSTVLIAGVVLATVALVVVAGGSVDRDDPLDPEGTGPEGAQALARVLEREGVEVAIARDADALEEVLGAGPAATVLVTDPDSMSPTTAERLVAAAGDARVLLAAPGPVGLDAFDLEVAVAPREGSGPVDADCAGDTSLGSDVDLDGLEVDPGTSEVYALPGCLATDDGVLLGEARAGLSLLGAPTVLTNDRITTADNAALALRLLGAGDRVVWYVPEPADVPADEGAGLGTLLPDWLVPTLWLALAVAASAVWWRARRFGPLAVEPLPVRVKASETTHSRGRLYHRAHDRGHAAGILRVAARERARHHLGLPEDRASVSATRSPDPLVDDVARRTGRSPDAVARLLTPGPAPATDRDLTALAHDLAELDREVRRT